MSDYGGDGEIDILIKEKLLTSFISAWKPILELREMKF